MRMDRLFGFVLCHTQNLCRPFFQIWRIYKTALSNLVPKCMWCFMLTVAVSETKLQRLRQRHWYCWTHGTGWSGGETYFGIETDDGQLFLALMSQAVLVADDKMVADNFRQNGDGRRLYLRPSNLYQLQSCPRENGKECSHCFRLVSA